MHNNEYFQMQDATYRFALLLDFLRPVFWQMFVLEIMILRKRREDFPRRCEERMRRAVQAQRKTRR